MKRLWRYVLAGGILIISWGAMAQVRDTHRSPSDGNCQSRVVLLPNRQKIDAEVANTTFERREGLSNRESLNDSNGMLFLFPKEDTYSFWMKDTKIPLDIIWLKNKQIVEITTLQAQSGNHIPSHTPSHTADSVLEINAGLADKHGLAVGAQLNWPDCATTE